jgi:hypothetical protein
MLSRITKFTFAAITVVIGVFYKDQLLQNSQSFDLPKPAKLPPECEGFNIYKSNMIQPSYTTAKIIALGMVHTHVGRTTREQCQPALDCANALLTLGDTITSEAAKSSDTPTCEDIGITKNVKCEGHELAKALEDYTKVQGAGFTKDVLSIMIIDLFTQDTLEHNTNSIIAYLNNKLASKNWVKVFGELQPVLSPKYAKSLEDFKNHCEFKLYERMLELAKKGTDLLTIVTTIRKECDSIEKSWDVISLFPKRQAAMIERIKKRPPSGKLLLWGGSAHFSYQNTSRKSSHDSQIINQGVALFYRTLEEDIPPTDNPYMVLIDEESIVRNGMR